MAEDLWSDTYVVAISERPALAALVAEWRVNAFSRPGGYDLTEMTTQILNPPDGLQETFVLFDGQQPAGTVALVSFDLISRPDLTPWLAWLFVEPRFRGRGNAAHLVRHVESYASVSVQTLWLYTSGAEDLYSRLNWRRVGMEEDYGHPVTLMRRDLPRHLA